MNVFMFDFLKLSYCKNSSVSAHRLISSTAPCPSAAARRAQSKTSAPPLHMENPLEPELNMCKNVSPGLLREIQKYSQNALQIMDMPGFHGPGCGSEVIHPWGIGALLTPVKAKRNGKGSVVIGSDIADVLRGLSRKPKPTDNSNGNGSTTALSGDESQLEGVSMMQVEHIDAKTVHTETLTALDASLMSDSTVTSQITRTLRVGANAQENSETDRLKQSTCMQDLVEEKHHDGTGIAGVDGTLSESQAAMKQQVPKLQITINNVKSRLFDRQHRQKGLVQ